MTTPTTEPAMTETPGPSSPFSGLAELDSEAAPADRLWDESEVSLEPSELSVASLVEDGELERVLWTMLELSVGSVDEEEETVEELWLLLLELEELELDSVLLLFEDVSSAALVVSLCARRDDQPQKSAVRRGTSWAFLRIC